MTFALANEKSVAAPSTSLVDPGPVALWDLALVGVIILVALVYLYRKLWLKRGACSDCTSKGSGSGCAACQIQDVQFDTKTPYGDLPGEKE